MPTPGEFTYYERIGPGGRSHALNKPFSDDRRGAMLMEVGALCLLLPPPPARVLECGCGTGWLSYFLANDVVGQDANSTAIEMARANPMFQSLDKEPEFIAGDFEELPFENGFDAVVFFDALHHSLDLRRALEQALRVLKTGGIVVASEPGTGHARRSAEFAQAWDVTDRDVPPSLTGSLARAAGFSQVFVYPHAELWGPSLYARRTGIRNALTRFAGIVAHLSFTRRSGIIVLVK
jgi:SAM-dependent methyltransferase